ncbi:MAG TPA: uracil-DNA glycosylase [Usitatibacter sp.]|nr:uracil-DNA glycosylase [Usitatibacter sp.]
MNRFLDLLEAGPSRRHCVFNPWADHDERDRPPRRAAPRRRLENMAAYVEARRRTARVMLMGEAPSHRGCRFTGIPFCSEVELTHKAALVAREPLALTSAAADEKPMSERSAAIVWDELQRAGCAREVVLWNAFPWHPYREVAEPGDATVGPCGPSSNRKPSLAEVREGREAFEALMRCFTHTLEVYAIGKVAEAALASWDGVRCAGYLRHPSMGGEHRFRAEFRQHVVTRLQP